MKRILYVRSGPYQVNFNSYNLQELGLAEAFAEKGYCCDVVYYHKTKNFNQTIKKNGYSINILWRKGIRLLRSAVYPQILKKNFLNKYEIVIVSEYSQIMSVLLSRRHNNVYIFNGPYYNLFKLPFIELIYDKMFCKFLNQHTKKIFCKTQMAKEYLEKKKLSNCKVVGVGLDISKFSDVVMVEHESSELLELMNGHRNIVYVGSISKRKNVALLIKVFNIIKKSNKYKDVQFVMIGKDEGGYLEQCQNLVECQSKDSVIYRKFIKNDQLKYIYDKADVFTLPSIHEIFGMVLLEAMYFGVPTVASASAGAKTLIQDGISGNIIENFDEKEWARTIQQLLDNENQRNNLGKNAHQRICRDFMWCSIAEKMIECFKED